MWLQFYFQLSASRKEEPRAIANVPPSNTKRREKLALHKASYGKAEQENFASVNDLYRTKRMCQKKDNDEDRNESAGSIRMYDINDIVEG